MLVGDISAPKSDFMIYIFFVLGKFEDLTHSVGGDIFVLDDKTIYIQVRIKNWKNTKIGIYFQQDQGHSELSP